MYTLFLDILGFASKVDSIEDFDERLTSKLFVYSMSDHAQRVLEENILEPLPYNLYELRRTYEAFHKVVGESIDVALEWGTRNTKCSVFEFSDSIFFATDSLDVIITFILEAMVGLYAELVPTRSGVAFGSFASLDLSMRQLSRGDLIVACPFLGSSVVRSYRCEGSGPKGLRSLVHPNCVDLINEYFEEEYLVPLPDQEKNSHATHEVNLLMVAGKNKSEEIANSYTKDLQQMKDRAPVEKHVYYDLTLEAIERMRIAARRDDSLTQ
jgi:hypothetical protein